MSENMSAAEKWAETAKAKPESFCRSPDVKAQVSDCGSAWLESPHFDDFFVLGQDAVPLALWLLEHFTRRDDGDRVIRSVAEMFGGAGTMVVTSEPEPRGRDFDAGFAAGFDHALSAAEAASSKTLPHSPQRASADAVVYRIKQAGTAKVPSRPDPDGVALETARAARRTKRAVLEILQRTKRERGVYPAEVALMDSLSAEVSQLPDPIPHEDPIPPMDPVP